MMSISNIKRHCIRCERRRGFFVNLAWASTFLISTYANVELGTDTTSWCAIGYHASQIRPSFGPLLLKHHLVHPSVLQICDLVTDISLGHRRSSLFCMCKFLFGHFTPGNILHRICASTPSNQCLDQRPYYIHSSIPAIASLYKLKIRLYK